MTDLPTFDDLIALRADDQINDAYERGVVAGKRRKDEAIDVAHLSRQREWSERTFGPVARTNGVIDHIRKELCEIEADPADLTEWADVVILALDGFWRAGASPEQIIETIRAKQARNEARCWPDWRTADPGKAIEHVRVMDGKDGVERGAVRS